MGELLTSPGMRGLHAHRFCLQFTSTLSRRGPPNGPLLGFHAEQVLSVLRSARSTVCRFCQRTGAAIRCCLFGCTSSFHGPCGLSNGCLFQYFGEYRAYCPSHRPVQHIVPLDAEGDTCPMCLDPMERPPSLAVLVTPCCRRLMHRRCIQQQASSAGSRCFRCPFCNNQEQFPMEMADHGIHVPVQEASWEREPHAFEELLFEYQHCDAPSCRCPMGRDYAGDDGSPWEVVVCGSCGARGMHAACARLDATLNWVCGECSEVIGEGSGSSYAEASESSSSESSEEEDVIVIDDDGGFGTDQLPGTPGNAAAIQGESSGDTTRNSASGGPRGIGSSGNGPVRLVCESVSNGTFIVRAVPENAQGRRNGAARTGRPAASSAGRRNEAQNRRRRTEERVRPVHQHGRRNSARETEPRARQQLGTPQRDRSGTGHSPCTEVACSICRPGGVQSTSANSGASLDNRACEICVPVTGQRGEQRVPHPDNHPIDNSQPPLPQNNIIVIDDSDAGAQPAAGGHTVNAAMGAAADVRPQNVIMRMPPTYVVPQGLYYIGPQNVGLQLQCIPVIGAPMVYNSAMVYTIRF